MNLTFKTMQDLEHALQKAVGARLFTVLEWIPSEMMLRRIYSNNSSSYPVGGTKSVEVDPLWLSQTVEDKRSFLGEDGATLRCVFADHAVIESLGCGAVITVPIDHGDGTAVLCLLDAEGRYDNASLRRVETFRYLAALPVRTQLKENS